MHKQTVEEIVYGLPNDIEIVIEYYHDITKTFYYKPKQINKRLDLLELKVIDFDYDNNCGHKSIRIIVED